MTENPYPDPAAIPSRARRVGATRRLRALAWMGWSPHHVAAEYRVVDDDLAEFVEGHKHRVVCSVDTWYAVAIAYDDLSMRFGPYLMARARAIASRWQPPLAWDDDALDNPLARPLAAAGRAGEAVHNTADHAVVWRRLNGDHTVPTRNADLHAIVREGNRRGWTDREIARQTGIRHEVVQKCRQREGLPQQFAPFDHIDRTRAGAA